MKGIGVALSSHGVQYAEAGGTSKRHMRDKEPYENERPLDAARLASMFVVQHSCLSDISDVMPACPGESLVAKRPGFGADA
jgi:hypothetical protein